MIDLCVFQVYFAELNFEASAPLAIVTIQTALHASLASG